jgi:hypothetical protein
VLLLERVIHEAGCHIPERGDYRVLLGFLGFLATAERGRAPDHLEDENLSRNVTAVTAGLNGYTAEVMTTISAAWR